MTEIRCFLPKIMANLQKKSPAAGFYIGFQFLKNQIPILSFESNGHLVLCSLCYQAKSATPSVFTSLVYLGVLYTYIRCIQEYPSSARVLTQVEAKLS